MKKIVKRIAAMGAAVMMMSSMAVGASAAQSYDLHYSSGAPNNYNVVGKTYNITATGASCITVTSSYFRSGVSGGYVSAKATNYSTNPISVNSTTTYYMYYEGNTIPKKNVQVKVKMNLVNYVSSKSLVARGTIK